MVLVLLAVFAVAFADVFLKEASKVGTFSLTLRSPWFWAAAGMYLFQVVAFAYLFVSKVELSAVGVIQTALYAIIVLGAGLLFYHETFSATQYVGMALALVGVFLINFKFS